MIEALKNLEKDAQSEIALLSDPKLLGDLKVKYLGRKGLFTSVTTRISEVAPEERRLAGQEMNRVKQALEELFLTKEKSFSSVKGPSHRRLDTTMPGTFYAPGSLHPLTQVTLDITAIFERLGFSIVDGPIDFSWGNDFKGGFCFFHDPDLDRGGLASQEFSVF